MTLPTKRHSPRRCEPSPDLVEAGGVAVQRTEILGRNHERNPVTRREIDPARSEFQNRSARSREDRRRIQHPPAFCLLTCPQTAVRVHARNTSLKEADQRSQRSERGQRQKPTMGSISSVGWQTSYWSPYGSGDLHSGKHKRSGRKSRPCRDARL